MDYNVVVQNNANIARHPIGGSVDVYKNGEYLKTVPFLSSGAPTVTSTYGISGLPTQYFPNNISTWPWTDYHCDRGCVEEYIRDYAVIDHNIRTIRGFTTYTSAAERLTAR